MPFSGNTYTLPASSIAVNGQQSDALLHNQNPLSDIETALTVTKTESSAAAAVTSTVGVAGLAAFQMANWRDIRAALGGAEFIVEKFTGATILLKFTAALAAAVALGGGTLIFESSHTVTAGFSAFGATGTNITVKQKPGSVITVDVAAATFARLFNVNNDGATSVTFENMNIVTNARVTTYIIESVAQYTTIRNCKINGTSSADGGTIAAHIRDSNSLVEGCEITNVSTGIRVLAQTTALEAVRVVGNRFRGLSIRGVLISTTTGLDTSRIEVSRNDFDEMSSGCQPIRIEDPTTGTLRVVSVNENIIMANGEFGAGDRVSFNGNIEYLLCNDNQIKDKADLGINISNGVKKGIVSGNRISNVDTAISIGAAADEEGANGANMDIAVFGNLATNCKFAGYALFDAHRCTMDSNHYSNPDLAETFDAVGLAAARSTYDAEAKDFAFYASDTVQYSVKLSATSGDWGAWTAYDPWGIWIRDCTRISIGDSNDFHVTTQLYNDDRGLEESTFWRIAGAFPPGKNYGAYGLAAGRSAFDAQPTNFKYFATDTGLWSYKLSNTSGNWSGTFAFDVNGYKMATNAPQVSHIRNTYQPAFRSWTGSAWA